MAQLTLSFLLPTQYQSFGSGGCCIEACLRPLGEGLQEGDSYAKPIGLIDSGVGLCSMPSPGLTLGSFSGSQWCFSGPQFARCRMETQTKPEGMLAKVCLKAGKHTEHGGTYL